MMAHIKRYTQISKLIFKLETVLQSFSMSVYLTFKLIYDTFFSIVAIDIYFHNMYNWYEKRIKLD